MKQILRELGIKMGMPGTRILEEIIEGYKDPKSLTDKEVQLVLEAWESRNYVPLSHLKNVDRVRPIITREDVEQKLYTEKEYERSYAERIGEYLLVLM